MHSQGEFHFCPVCGGKIRALKLKEKEPERLLCGDCAYIFYLDPKVVACSIVEWGKRIVLLKRNISPQKGKWVVPGGYVERGEEVVAAARREAEEECGLIIDIDRLLGVYSYPGVVEIMVFYVARRHSGDLIAGDETQDVMLCKKEEIPWRDLAFQSTGDALRDYCRLDDSCEIIPGERKGV